MSILTATPVIGPYASFIYQYTATLQNVLIASGNFQMDTFLLCMAMAYIGGSGKSITLATENTVQSIPVSQMAPGVQIIIPPSQTQTEEEVGETLESMEKITPSKKKS
jgi:hypothetical protein